MLRTHFLFDPAGHDRVFAPGVAQPWIRNALGIVLVMPRANCVYARLQAQGVPTLRLRDFARLQLATLSPFQAPDYFLIRVGSVLHAWIWDSSVVTEFARRQGFSEDLPIKVIPSSVCVVPPKQPSVFWARSFEEGVEAQLWSAGKLIHSGWFEAVPSADEWEAWRQEVQHRESIVWPEALPPVEALERPMRPFAQGFLKRQKLLWGRSLVKVWPVALCAATAALAGYGAWLYARIETQQQAIAAARGARSAAATELEPLQRARQQALLLQSELKGFQGLVERPAMSEVLKAAAEVVYELGLVIRELELENATLRVTLVAGQGELKMSRLIEAVEAHPMFDGASFVDAAPQGGMRFTWHVKGLKS